MSYTAFSDEMRAAMGRCVAIGRYAAENGNVAALRKLRFEITDLGERRDFHVRARYCVTFKKVAADFVCDNGVVEVSLLHV